MPDQQHQQEYAELELELAIGGPPQSGPPGWRRGSARRRRRSRAVASERHQKSSRGSIRVEARSTRMLMTTKMAGGEQRHALDHREIALQHRLHGQETEARIVEDEFDDQHAAEQRADLHAEQVQDGDGGVAHHVVEEDAASATGREPGPVRRSLCRRQRPRSRSPDAPHEQRRHLDRNDDARAGSYRRTLRSRWTGSNGAGR